VEGGTMGEKFPRILPKVVTSTSLLGSFTCHKFMTWDRRLYFPSKGRRAEDFFALKNLTASAGFEPANLKMLQHVSIIIQIIFRELICSLLKSMILKFVKNVKSQCGDAAA
jgi:hypothetical protein